MLAVGTIPCAVCGDAFQRITRNGKYCSAFCANTVKNAARVRKRIAPHPRTCAVCKATFGARSPRAKFCGDLCKSRDRNRRITERVAIEPRSCSYCGGMFTSTDTRKRLCSVPCQKAQALRARCRSQLAGAFETVPCADCGTPFERTRRTVLFCSQPCRYRRKLARNRVTDQARRDAEREQRQPQPIIIKPRPPVVIVRPKKASAYVPYTSPKLSQRGITYSGYSESRPREVTSTLTSCTHCRAYGTDTLGRVQHSSWCREAVAG